MSINELIRFKEKTIENFIQLPVSSVTTVDAENTCSIVNGQEVKKIATSSEVSFVRNTEAFELSAFTKEIIDAFLAAISSELTSLEQNVSRASFFSYYSERLRRINNNIDDFIAGIEKRTRPITVQHGEAGKFISDIESNLARLREDIHDWPTLPYRNSLLEKLNASLTETANFRRNVGEESCVKLTVLSDWCLKNNRVLEDCINQIWATQPSKSTNSVRVVEFAVTVMKWAPYKFSRLAILRGLCCS